MGSCHEAGCAILTPLPLPPPLLLSAEVKSKAMLLLPAPLEASLLNKPREDGSPAAAAASRAPAEAEVALLPTLGG